MLLLASELLVIALCSECAGEELDLVDSITKLARDKLYGTARAHAAS